MICQHIFLTIYDISFTCKKKITIKSQSVMILRKIGRFHKISIPRNQVKLRYFMQCHVDAVLLLVIAIIKKPQFFLRSWCKKQRALVSTITKIPRKDTADYITQWLSNHWKHTKERYQIPVEIFSVVSNFARQTVHRDWSKI